MTRDRRRRPISLAKPSYTLREQGKHRKNTDLIYNGIFFSAVVWFPTIAPALSAGSAGRFIPGGGHPPSGWQEALIGGSPKQKTENRKLRT